MKEVGKSFLEIVTTPEVLEEMLRLNVSISALHKGHRLAKRTRPGHSVYFGYGSFVFEMSIPVKGLASLDKVFKSKDPKQYGCIDVVMPSEPVYLSKHFIDRFKQRAFPITLFSDILDLSIMSIQSKS